MKKNTDSNITCSPPSRRTLRNCTFIVDGVPMSLTKAAAALGYASISGLAPKIRQRGIPENSDISHLKKNPAREVAVAKYYIVNGQRVSTTEAAELLGFTLNSLYIRLRKLNLPEESDISHLKNKRPMGTAPRYYIVNGQRVSTNRAWKMLGFRSYAPLFSRIEELNLPPESDISHLKDVNPARAGIVYYLVDGQRVSVSHAAKLLGFNNSNTLYVRLKKHNLPPESDISHIKPGRRQQNEKK